VSTLKGAESPSQTRAVVDGEATKHSPNKLASASSAIMHQHLMSSKSCDRSHSERSSFGEESSKRAHVLRSNISPSSGRTTRSTPSPLSSRPGTECIEESTGEYVGVALNSPSQTDEDKRSLLVTTAGTTEDVTNHDDVGSVAEEKEYVLLHNHDRDEGGNENSVGDDLTPDSQSIPRHGALQAKWEHMFDRLVDFKEKNGHCLVPNRYSQDPSLGAWVSTQRR
jgi:Helicase associated domain